MSKEISSPRAADLKATAEDEKGKMKDWAVLIYLGGQNNLFDEMVFAVKEMKSSVPSQSSGRRGGANEFNFHALVQFAAEETARPTSAYPLPRRFKLKPGEEKPLGDDYDPTYQPLGQDGHYSSIEGYKRELVEFLVWGITKGRAKHYTVIFSGHGLGIESDFLTKDSTPVQSLTVKDLRDVLRDDYVKLALEKVGKSSIDILGLDSCLMSMAEVGYELRNEADLLVASQGSEANVGWPYKSIFAWLHNNAGADPERLAKALVDNFVAYYDDFACAADSSADLSAYRLRRDKRKYMKELKNAVDSLAEACLDIIGATDYQMIIWEPACNDFARALIFAHWYAQTYHFDQYADIQDLCEVLNRSLPANNGKYEEVKKRCGRVIKAVAASVISSTERKFSGPLYQYSHGLSIYLPWSDIYKPYGVEQLDFLKDGKWREFVEAYIKFTRRPPRRGPQVADRGYDGTKDSPPHSKGIDDPRMRAKNPPSLWQITGNYSCNLKKPIFDE